MIFSRMASLEPASGPATISAVAHASARAQEASTTVTEATPWRIGDPIRGSMMCG